MDKKTLAGLGIAELKSLQIEIDKLITTKQEEAKNALIADFQAKAKELGLSLSDLVGSSPATKKTKVAPKYKNPADPSQTWTGRGRKPNWVTQLLKEGKTLDDLKI